MSNFGFLRDALPEVHAECQRAESYLSSDPYAACLYSRRAIEHVVGYIYRLRDLPEPYRNDLSARINADAMLDVVGAGIVKKLNVIRRLGNLAAHATGKQLDSRAALTVLRQLFDVTIWVAFNLTSSPDAVPTPAEFDSQLAQRSSPLTREQVAKLAQKFKEKDEALRREAEENERLAKQNEQLAAELARLRSVQDQHFSQLRQDIAVAQAAKQHQDLHDYTMSEADTRVLIDLLLSEAGWPLNEARDREFEVDGMPNKTGRGYVDYVLWGEDGLPLALVEAKKTSKSAQLGQRQAEIYADRLEARFGQRPIILLSNGYEHWIWDDAAGYPPRQIQGFYTRDELALAVQRRRTRSTLSGEAVNTEIAGRPYQTEAIQAVADAFDRRRREALLVMATGTGKTRTAIALVELLQRHNWVKRVLFLADRTALVKQAANAFTANLPGSTTVNLLDEPEAEGRVYVSTYQTMMNLIDKVDEGKRRFGPGYFDLVIIDEAHRSVYAKYGSIFDWFDSLLVGLTATPKDEVDHNTYRLFNLEDGVPTANYGLEQAIDEGYLVPPRAISTGTKFLRQGIKYSELSPEEQEQWDLLDWGGEPPDEVGAEELNRFLFNENTVDRVLAELMANGIRVAGGDRIGKTIVFAKNQQHAEFIQQRFDRAYPELKGTFARVITHSVSYAQSLIDQFSLPESEPHIAISVDMLDTGIDVPEIVNLVFFKTVRSKTKFWQMIGRGTRLRPDLFGPGIDKREFIVFDYCGNLEFFSEDLPQTPARIAPTLSQRLFSGRVELLAALQRTECIAEGDRQLAQATAKTLRSIIGGMNPENFLVRPHLKYVERYAVEEPWSELDDTKQFELREHLAALPSAVRDTDEQAKRFDLLVLTMQLSLLRGETPQFNVGRQKVQSIAAHLLTKTSVPEVERRADLLDAMEDEIWWQDVTLPQLEQMRQRVRGLVRFLEKSRSTAVYTDFEDTAVEGHEVHLPQVTPGVDLNRFEAKIRAFLREYEDHLTLQRLRRNRPLTQADLDSLQQMLLEHGVAEPAEVARASDQAGGFGRFVRSLIGLDRSAVNEAFARFLEGGGYNVTQIRFIEQVINELVQNGVVAPERLFEPPYTDTAPTGPFDIFEPIDVTLIVDTLREFERNTGPAAA